jgi:uncharacterized protein YndB with AHSA1/START domain
MQGTTSQHSTPGREAQLPAGLEPVTLAAAGKDWDLIVDRVVPQPPDRIWAALTDPADLAQWGPFETERPLTSTGPVQLTTRDAGEAKPSDEHVLAVEPGTLVEYSWGSGVLRWEVQPHERGARLILRHRFPEQSEAPSYAAGWQLCLQSLEELLGEGATRSRVGTSAPAYGWQELHDKYRAYLGIDA